MINIEQYRPKVHVLVLCHAKAGVIGPFFVDEIVCPEDHRKTLTSAHYLKCLEDEALPALRSKLSEDDWNRRWFQQDGARPHRSPAIFSLLERNFESRVIALGTDHSWPSYSPDLNLLDYFFWPYMKQLMRDEDFGDFEDLKLTIIRVCDSIPTELIAKSAQDFPKRILALKDAEGWSFEPTFEEFKRDLEKLRLPCDICDGTHDCLCRTCQENCLYDWEMGSSDDDDDDHFERPDP